MIVLEEVYDKNGKYLGKVTVDLKDLTLECLDMIRKDKDDKMGWGKYRKVLKEKGYDVEVKKGE